MKRAVAVLATTLVAAVFATPASASVLSAAQAYSVAGSYGRTYQRAWGVGWSDYCSRLSPWRFQCKIEVFNATRSTDCERWFEVTSPVWGTRLQTANWSPWAC